MEANIPTVTEDNMAATPPLCLHVSVLSFDPSASVKVPPGKALTLGILEDILNNGFVTAGDPLRLTLNDKIPIVKPNPVAYEQLGEAAIAAQCLGYGKAQARCCTLLALLSVLIEEGYTADSFKEAPQCLGSLLDRLGAI